MSSPITKSLSAQEPLRELTPKKVNKAERNAKIEIFAAAAFVLIALGAGIYLAQDTNVVAGVFLSCGAGGAGLLLSMYAFSRGERPDLSDDETRRARIKLLSEGTLWEVYEQLYKKECGVSPYVRAGLLDRQQGMVISHIFDEYFTQNAKMEYWSPSNALYYEGEDVRGVGSGRHHLYATKAVDHLETIWCQYQRTLFLPKLIDVRLDAVDIRLV